MRESPDKFVYLATSLFTKAEQDFGFRLTELLEQLGVGVYFPWRDAGDAELRIRFGKDWKKINEEIFNNNFSALSKATIVVAILDGADVDSGVAIELGFAHSLKKRIIGLRTDFRTQGEQIGSVNIMVSHVCDAIHQSTTDLISGIQNTFGMVPQKKLEPALFYNFISEEYDDPLLHPTTFALKKKEEEIVKDLVGPRKFFRALDIGCGNGNFLINTSAERKVGVEISPLMLFRHWKKMKSASYLLSSGRMECLPNDYFDIIHSSFVIDHIDDLNGFFSEVLRLASKKAIFILSSLMPDEFLHSRPNSEILEYNSSLVGKIQVESHLRKIPEIENSLIRSFIIDQRRIEKIGIEDFEVVVWSMFPK